MFFERPTATEPVEVPYVLQAAMGVAALALVAAFVYPGLIAGPVEVSSLIP
jgi:hypothetical protein